MATINTQTRVNLGTDTVFSAQNVSSMNLQEIKSLSNDSFMGQIDHQEIFTIDDALMKSQFCSDETLTISDNDLELDSVKVGQIYNDVDKEDVMFKQLVRIISNKQKTFEDEDDFDVIKAGDKKFSLDGGITIITFDRNIIGQGIDGDGFNFTFSGNTYKSYRIRDQENKQTISGVEWNESEIKKQFIIDNQSMFIIVKNDDDKSDVSKIQGLLFPKLGLLVMNSNISSNLTNVNITILERIFRTTIPIHIQPRKFNLSNNPSWTELGADGVRTFRFKDDPHVYITAIGLYNDQNQLLAIAKLSQPVRKDRETGLNFKIVIQR